MVLARRDSNPDESAASDANTRDGAPDPTRDTRADRSVPPPSSRPADGDTWQAVVGRGTALDSNDPPELLLAGEEEGALEDARGTIRSGKLAGRTMWSAIWILALPVLLQQTMAALVGMVDKLLAGNLPESVVLAGLDAIGVGSYVGWLIGICMTGVGIGGQAIIARSMGRGSLAEARSALGQCLVLAFLWGGLVGAVMWILAEPLARYCSLGPDAIEFCRQYVRTVALSMPLCGVMMVGSMCLHGAGETVRPSAIAIGVNLVNIVASWLISGVTLSLGEYQLEGVLPVDPARWGVVGIAAGTAISYTFGAVMIVVILLRGVKDLHLDPGEVRLQRAMTWRIVRLGVPNFAEGLAMWGVNLFVMRFIGDIAEMNAVDGQVQEGLVGSHVIAVQWEAFSFLPGFAMGTAAGALAGQYLGAGNAAMARRTILACTGVGMALMGGLGLIFMTQGELLTRIISDNPVSLAHTPNLLFICGTIQIFFAMTMIIRQGLRGVGDVRWTLLITFVSSYFIRLPAAYVLGVVMGYGLEGIWMALCGEIVVRGLLFGSRFLHGGWARVRV